MEKYIKNVPNHQPEKPRKSPGNAHEIAVLGVSGARCKAMGLELRGRPGPKLLRKQRENHGENG